MIELRREFGAVPDPQNKPATYTRPVASYGGSDTGIVSTRSICDKGSFLGKRCDP